MQGSRVSGHRFAWLKFGVISVWDSLSLAHVLPLLLLCNLLTQPGTSQKRRREARNSNRKRETEREREGDREREREGEREREPCLVCISMPTDACISVCVYIYMCVFVHMFVYTYVCACVYA